MDKLWASAWCRNQSEIKDLSKSLTTQNTSLSNKISSAEAEKPNIELKQQFSGLREKLMSTASANNNLTSRLNELDKRLKAAEEAARKQISTPAQGTGL